MIKFSTLGLNEDDSALMETVLRMKEEMSGKNVDYVVQTWTHHDPETDAHIPFENGKMYGAFRVISPYHNVVSQFETISEMYAHFSMQYEQFLNGHRGTIHDINKPFSRSNGIKALKL